MKTELKAEITMRISDGERERISNEMSAAMGGHIMSVGKTDFASWTPEEWMQLVSVAFDVGATQAFMQRVYVSPPYAETGLQEGDIPF